MVGYAILPTLNSRLCTSSREGTHSSSHKVTKDLVPFGRPARLVLGEVGDVGSSARPGGSKRTLVLVAEVPRRFMSLLAGSGGSPTEGDHRTRRGSAQCALGSPYGVHGAQEKEEVECIGPIMVMLRWIPRA